MPKKKFSDEQIAFALRQADSGTAVSEICRKMSIAEATFYWWKKIYAGMGWPKSACGPAGLLLAQDPSIRRRRLISF